MLRRFPRRLTTQGEAGSKLILLSETFLITGTAGTFGATTQRVFIELIGGGGGGGGASGATSNSGAGGGGGGGAYSSIILDVTPGGSYTYAIGAAGAAGAAAAGTGGTGGQTSITVNAVTVTAPGGLGGVGMAFGTTSLSVAGGAGGAAGTGGDINVPGNDGFPGVRINGTIRAAGNGAPSWWGAGGRNPSVSGNGVTSVNATGRGAGGSGASSGNNTSRAGGLGTAGAILIVQYGYL